jgi:hypothetical protein
VSRICTGANQGPVRLANGAIAKTLTAKKEPVAASATTMTAAPKSSKYTLLKEEAGDPSEEKGYKCSKCSQVNFLGIF